MKRQINVGANNGKMGKAPPAWILALKDGTYTVEELSNVSGTTKISVRNMMKKYALKHEYVEVNDFRKISVYHWSHDNFLKIFYGNKDMSN